MLLTWARRRMVFSMPLWPFLVAACGGALLRIALNSGNVFGSVIACFMLAAPLSLLMTMRLVWDGRVRWGAKDVLINARCYVSILPLQNRRTARYRVHLVPLNLELDCLTRWGALRAAERIEHALGVVQPAEALRLRAERDQMMREAGNPIAKAVGVVLLFNLFLIVLCVAIYWLGRMRGNY